MGSSGETGGWIGKRMTRREDPRLLKGEGRFVDDLAPEGCLALEILRSPYGPGSITCLNLDDAAGMPGVVAILTAADLGGLGQASVNALLPGLAPRPLRLLADGEIEAMGQAVAAVVAQTRDQARDAAEMILLEVEEAPPEETEPPPALTHRWQGGMAPQKVARQISVTQSHALLAPMAMEPRAALAQPEGQGLTLHLSTQTPQRCRDDLAAILGLPADTLRVVARDVGGAFGGKASLMPEDALVALAAHRLGRPVKWVASRAEEFLAATQGRGARISARLQLDESGAPLGLTAELAFPLGHWMPYSALAPIRNAGRILPGPYAVPHVDVRAQAMVTAGPAVNIYRGAGRPEAAMIMERLADRAAEAMGLDPLDWRLAHLGQPGPLAGGEVVCSGDYAALLHRLAEATGYRALRNRQQQRRAGGEVCGLGIGLYIEPCGQGWETASITLEAGGRLVARTGSSAQGQGRETAFAQIVADAIGCDPGRVGVIHSDTAEVAQGIGALASRSTAIGGTAMWHAAEKLGALLRDHAAGLAGCAAGEVRLSDAGAETPARRIGWAELAAAGPFRADHRHEAAAEAWASGAVLAEVTVDPETGALTIDRITWVDDAGRVLNPLLVEGQLWGGLAQGIGAALMEQVVYRDGQLLTGSLMDYAVPRASDMPPLRMISAPIPSPANPLGFKGVGEAGCIGVPAALMNAVQDALLPFGAPDLSFPLTSEKIWRAIQRLP
jgi:carbon-monoxide dehydrogenase large subunit